MISPSNPADALPKIANTLTSGNSHQTAVKLSISHQTAIPQSNNVNLQLSSNTPIPKPISNAIQQNTQQTVQITLNNSQNISAQVGLQQTGGKQLSIQLSQQLAALLTTGSGNTYPAIELKAGPQGLLLTVNSSNNMPKVSTSNTSTASTQSSNISSQPNTGNSVQKPSTETDQTQTTKVSINSGTNNKPNPLPSSISNVAIKQISQQLRANLPHQQTIKHLSSTLQNTEKAIQLSIPHKHTNTSNQTSQSQYLQQVQQGIKQLLRTLPTIEQVQSTQGLQNALMNSGLFLENKLALLATAKNSPEVQKLLESSINKDVKTQLLRLASNILNTPHPITKPGDPSLNQWVNQLLIHSKQQNNGKKSEHQQKADAAIKVLAKQLAGSLANTEVNQMESLRHTLNQSTENPKMISWNTEIAIDNEYIDHLKLNIEKEEPSNNEDDIGEQWRVNLSFNLHDNGKLNVLLSIIGNAVGAQLWSEQENTHLNVSKYKNELKDMLIESGVEVKEISCHHGTPKLSENQLERHYFSKHPLIDVKT